jgi:hypothetical protein
MRSALSARARPGSRPTRWRTHIARQHHQIRGVGVNFMHQLTIERFPVGKLTLRHLWPETDKRHPACGIQ